ncbi:MAG: hypothetical protein ABI885_11360 [Gammaproteobacteria bacterium]
MKPVEGGAPVRLAQILGTAHGLTCPYPVLRDALDYFIAVREEASALASTP